MGWSVWFHLALWASPAQQRSWYTGGVSYCLRERALQVEVVPRGISHGAVAWWPRADREGAACFDQPVKVIMLVLPPGTEVKLKTAVSIKALWKALKRNQSVQTFKSSESSQSVIRAGLTADVGVLVWVVSAVVDEITQVVLRNAVAVGTGVLLWCTWLVWRKRRGAVQEADIVYHHITHVADPSFRPEHNLTMNNKQSLSPVSHIHIN